VVSAKSAVTSFGHGSAALNRTGKRRNVLFENLQPSQRPLRLPAVTIELINTGTELLLGRVLNTHQQWICRQLADAGYLVSHQVTVPDSASGIDWAVREALGRADLVITTGGLGPTSDDLTRELIAKLLGKSLRPDETVLANIQRIFQRLNRPMLDSTRVQALVPESALVLHNAHGTAPGLAMEVQPNPFRSGAASWLIMLPGPPRELRPMFTVSVMPLLRRLFPVKTEFVCRTLRATGIGESAVEAKISVQLQHLVENGLELGYCARPGQVDVRLAARATTAKSIVAEAESIVRARLGAALYGEEEEEIEQVVIRRLTERGETLALAESCTGGCIAHRLTNVPGASGVLLAGLVAYSNDSKQLFLGVDPATLVKDGAVSPAVAQQMAEGARKRTGATYALSVTGIAGPGGGSPHKPVGTVFIGLAGPCPTQVEHKMNPFDRETFKNVTAQQALDMLRRAFGS
jgi:nicotinamide-nucleotide amidase